MTKPLEMTPEIAKAAALDAGDRNRRKRELHGAWTREDWDVACDEYDRLMRLVRFPSHGAARSI
jgi:hypothetical protein